MLVGQALVNYAILNAGQDGIDCSRTIIGRQQLECSSALKDAGEARVSRIMARTRSPSASVACLSAAAYRAAYAAPMSDIREVGVRYM